MPQAGEASLPAVSKLFDEYYFAHGCGSPYQRDEQWLALFEGIGRKIVRHIAPQTVLDAGCAMGFLVEYLREQEIEAYGIDISDYAIGKVFQDIQPYCWQGSITEPFPQNYDLIVCIEVLEHLPSEQVEQAITNLCQHTDDILFSSTPFDYKEASHFHVQSPEYWTELFALNGFFRDIDFDASFITPWAVRYRRRNEPTHRLVRDYDRKFWQLWKERQYLRLLTLEMRQTLASQEQNMAAQSRQLEQLSKQMAECQQLLRQYEQGKFIRFMRWSAQVKQRLSEMWSRE